MGRKTAVRKHTIYGMRVKGPNYTERKMTVGDLIHELQAFPKGALALISADEEGNQYKHLCEVNGYTLEEEGVEDFRSQNHTLTDDLLNVGDPYVIIWPHG